MPGGILQLFATGTEDIYLSDNPNITFFKTVYRRHTNFSRGEVDLNFTSRLDFGKEGYSRIEHYGDLLYRLFLVVQLPTINISFQSLTVGQVQTILSSPLYEITWTTDRPPDSKFTQIDYIQVSKLIDEKVTDLNNGIAIIDEILLTLTGTGKFVASIWQQNNPKDANNPVKYLNDAISDYFQYDKYNLQYQIIAAQLADTSLQKLLANSLRIQNIMQNDFVAYATSEDNNPYTFNDNNLQFLYNTDTSAYVITGSLNQVNSNAIFQSGISTSYGPVPYTYLDAYKIFNYILVQNPIIISSNSDIQNLKALLLTNIEYGLSINIRQLNNIYNSLNDISRFIFYRKFPVIIVGSGKYDTTSAFVNGSQIINSPAQLNDQYTNVFTVSPTVNQPNTVNSLFATNTSNSVQTFHTENRDLFRTSLITPYFNDLLSLWSGTDALTNPESPILDPPIPPNMYYLNNLWFSMTKDIPNSINTYLLKKPSGLDPVTIANLYTFLQNIQNNIILPTIRPLITKLDNYTEIISTLNSTIKSVTGENGDIIMTGLIRPGISNSIIIDPLYGQITIPDFITQYYLKGLRDFGEQSQPNFNTVALPLLVNIVNLYSTPINNIPEYNTYITRNHNIYADPARQINTDSDFYTDVQCSIWNHLFNQFIRNYNNLYNQILLGINYYLANLGSEVAEYLVQISNDYLDYPIDTQSTFDYYRRVQEYKDKIPIISGPTQFIGQYLASKLQVYATQLAFYEANRPLLDMRNIVIPRPDFFYEYFLNVVNRFTVIIETTTNPDGTLTYRHLFHDDPNRDIVLLTQKSLADTTVQYSEPRNNALDITAVMKSVADFFYNSAGKPNISPINPYSLATEPSKYNLWTKYQNSFVAQNEIDKFDSVFSWLYGPNAAQNLFKFQSQISVLYNGFVLENDVYMFMRDYVTQQSSLKDLPGLLGDTVQITNDNLYNYYTAQKAKDTEILENIEGNDNTLGLKAILQRSLNAGISARFAWVKRIGHYLIEQIYIKIDDQVIDKQYGEWLEIWHSLTRRDKKEAGYSSLIGDVPELTEFNTRKKYDYECIIPLQFWFCKNIGLALPLVGLHNADIRLYVKLRKFEELAYYDAFTTFRSTPRLECKMVGEFIYVEDEERTRLATSKLEYLIDTVQYNGDVSISKNDADNYGFINTTMWFKNPSKSFFWVLQNLAYINGSLDNGERKWNVYSYDANGTINPIDQARIKFNAREREGEKDIIFYNFIQPYERYYATPSTGINIYTFALDPESTSLSGSANMSMIDDTSIEYSLKPVVKDTAKFRMAVYSLSMNLLRVFSGLGGLAFQQ